MLLYFVLAKPFGENEHSKSNRVHKMMDLSNNVPLKFIINSGFNKTMVTMVAVMKKFHGSRVPRPRMKNMIHTALYLEDMSCYSHAVSLLSICFIWESYAQTFTRLVERRRMSLCLSDGSVTDLFQNLASNLKSHGDSLHSVIMNHNATDDLLFHHFKPNKHFSEMLLWKAWEVCLCCVSLKSKLLIQYTNDI